MTSISCFGSIHTLAMRIPKKKVCNFVGGEVSPILTNIYLDKLDQFVEQTLLPRYNHGETRQTNPAYRIIHKRMHRCKQAGQPIEARELRKALQRLPQGDPYDPHYRRLRYARYADGTPVQA